jgi:hypothetical protein
MKKTIVINLLGGPGTGKSTTAAAVFSELKCRGVDCELSSEFAKDLVWEQRYDTFKDQLYIFAKQAHRLFRLVGKVDVVITDSPLILTCFYGQNDQPLCDFCIDYVSRFNNLNYFLIREKEYNPNGRNQTEAEARQIDVGLRQTLDNYNQKYKELPGNMSSVKVIADEVMELLKGE